MKTQSHRLSVSDRIFHCCVSSWLIFSLVLVLYPLIYCISCSFSSTQAITQGQVVLWPVDFSLKAYRAILEYPLLHSGFFNSLLYVAGGTVVAVGLILLAAYPLSRRDLPGRKFFQVFFVITMFFGGGLIPGYILMMNLNLVGSRWSQIIGAGFSCYNMIIVKTYFQSSLPAGLLDAAHIDGCSDVRYFFTIALPLAIPVIAVMVLFNAVGIWNGYFGGLLYLNKPNTYSFQMVLRNILFVAQLPPEILSAMDPDVVAVARNMLQQLRYSVLVVGALPMMILYPFIQKYFIRGLMIGSLKE
ncbi:MAG: carbohydrate ABC transporter permease [Treponema sp.]|jgi:multiple sugar transport system permease protein/putative aldouronate transport system permease protein|nr:carbohydrate ABC transporter permease [Treponema sp.]